MRAFLLFLIAGVTGFTLWWIVSTPAVTVDDDLLSPPASSGPGISMGEIRIAERRESQILFELMAQSAVVTEDQSDASLSMFSLVAYPEKGRTITFVADKGSLRNQRTEVYATGGIVAIDDMGRALITDSMTMYDKGERFETDDVVRIVGPQFVITGTGMVARPTLKTVELKSNVTALFMPGNR